MARIFTQTPEGWACTFSDLNKISNVFALYNQLIRTYKYFMPIFLNFIFVFSLFFSFSVFAQKISNIEIIGTNKLSRGTILNYIPIEVGDDYTEKSSSQIIRSLYKTNFFKGISINLVESNLIIRVSENPAIKFIDFKNFKDGKVLSKELIEKILIQNKLNVGEIFNESTFESLINEIKKLYREKGYYKTDVTISSSTDSSNRIGIEVNIQEGEVARIRSMKVSGNSNIQSDTILGLFDIGEPDFFLINYFTEKDHFNQTKLNSGLEKLKSLYVNKGFLDFEITGTSVNLSQDLESVDISIVLTEGNRYKFGKILYTGDLLNFSNKALNNLLEIKDDSFFSREKLISGVKSINAAYSNLGYVFANINSTLDKIDSEKLINVNIEIDIDKLIYINRIAINGNTRTQDNVIRRELLLNEGEVFSSSAFEESINRIKRLGFFTDVNYEIIRSVDNNDKINILINVTETKTGEFSIGLSHSNATGASFNTGIQEKNFLGTGNTLNAKFNNSKAVEELSIYFLNPSFNQQKHSISYGFYTKKIDASNLDISSYVLNENGLITGYGIPLSNSSKIMAEANISSLDITCGSLFSSSGYEPTQCLGDNSSELGIKISYNKNTLNDFNFPTDGSQESISLKVAIPPGDFKYVSLNALNKNFYPVLEDKTVKVLSNASIASGLFDEELPFFKRYYGGGNSSVRGFSFNSIGSKYPDGKAKGGELSLYGSTEIISPVPIEDLKNIRISGFVDAGTISEKIVDFTPSDIRVSAGAAVNWLTPIGPIGIFLAKPLIKKSGDNTETFSFSIGSSF